MWIYPFRVRLHFPPGKPRQQSLGHCKLPRSRKLVGFLPRGVAPGTPMRRWAIRLFERVDLPNSVGSVGMPCCSAQNARPEHEPLDFLAAGFSDAFVTDFTIDYRHC